MASGIAGLPQNPLTSAKRKATDDLTPHVAKKRVIRTSKSGKLEKQQFEETKEQSSRSKESVHSTFQTSPAQTALNIPASKERVHDGSQSTSPSSNGLSQTSTSSNNIDTPSTTYTNISVDGKLSFVSPIKNGNSMLERRSQDVPYSPTISARSRSSSVISLDNLTRSSGRTRKPTTKAQVLADAGTKFYRSLRKSPDSSQADGTRGFETAELGSPIEFSATPTQGLIEEPDAVVDSVEATPIRTSPRQRKPTAKASKLASNNTIRNHSSSPAPRTSQVVKPIKLNSVIPENPSKLRYSLSSTEDEQRQHSELDEADDADESGDDKIEIDEADIECTLTCMTPSARLLAFAKYAAEASDSEEDMDDADFDALLNTALKHPEGPRTISEKILKSYCSCNVSIAGHAADFAAGSISPGSRLLQPETRPGKEPKPDHDLRTGDSDAEELSKPKTIPKTRAKHLKGLSEIRSARIRAFTSTYAHQIQAGLRFPNRRVAFVMTIDTNPRRNNEGLAVTSMPDTDRGERSQSTPDNRIKQKAPPPRVENTDSFQWEKEESQRSQSGYTHQEPSLVSSEARPKRQRKVPAFYAIEPLLDDVKKQPKKVKIKKKSSSTFPPSKPEELGSENVAAKQDQEDILAQGKL